MIKIIIILLLFQTINLFSSYINTYSFLDINEAGKSSLTSMSGASTVSGLFSIYGNPAGFGKYTSKGIILSDTENLGDTRKFNLFYGSVMKYFNYIIGIKYFYLKTPINSNINYNAYDFNILLARKIFNLLNYGITIKYIHSTIYKYTASLFLIDTGINYKIFLPLIYGDIKTKNFTAGIYLKNIGFCLKGYNNEEEIPYSINTGVKYLFLSTQIFSSSILGNYSITADRYNFLSGGMEFNIFKYFETGISYKSDKSNDYFFIDIGTKFYFKNFYYELYYNIGIINELNATHSITLIIRRFNKF